MRIALACSCSAVAVALLATGSVRGDDGIGGTAPPTVPFGSGTTFPGGGGGGGIGGTAPPTSGATGGSPSSGGSGGGGIGGTAPPTFGATAGQTLPVSGGGIGGTARPTFTQTSPPSSPSSAPSGATQQEFLSALGAALAEGTSATLDVQAVTAPNSQVPALSLLQQCAAQFGPAFGPSQGVTWEVEAGNVFVITTPSATVTITVQGNGTNVTGAPSAQPSQPREYEAPTGGQPSSGLPTPMPTTKPTSQPTLGPTTTVPTSGRGKPVPSAQPTVVVATVQPSAEPSAEQGTPVPSAEPTSVEAPTAEPSKPPSRVKHNGKKRPSQMETPVPTSKGRRNGQQGQKGKTAWPSMR